MKTAVIYIHGQGGDASEAEHYRALFAGCDVFGIDYRAQTPAEARAEFPALYAETCAGYDRVILIANSIGAFFAMSVPVPPTLSHAFFISPIVDMERLILDMMGWAGVSEEELRERGTVDTAFGQTLSWDYLCDVRRHPISWRIPTDILYGSKDNLTSIDTVSSFAAKIHATLTVMDGGEHWFHTETQMRFLDDWIAGRLRA